MSNSNVIGDVGEALTASKLRSDCDMTILRNIYLTRQDGKSVEIDMVGISDKGIFVIENKNYSGFVKCDKDKCISCGKCKSVCWKVIYPNIITSMLNPVKQNEIHIEALWRLLRQSNFYLNPSEIHNVVIFNHKVRLEKNGLDNVFLLDEFVEHFKGIYSTGCESELYKQKKEIYELFKKYSDQSEEAKNRHIKALEEWYLDRDRL